jgi:para-nitrobenzyl esterase
MMKNYLAFALILLWINAFSQDCSTGRYAQEVFTDYNVTSELVYGSNLRFNGNSINLLVDVYEPDGDTETNRPLIIMAHGGSFLGGSKTGNDVMGLIENFVKRGYVVASISYRIGMNGIPFPGPDESDASEAVMRATQDARAAVRFFRKSVAEDGNPYGIDSDEIYMAGVSAGGIMALHLAYLDKDEEIPSFIDQNQPGLSGGVEGESGNPGYPSTVKAIVNMAGALGDVEWMEAGDTPLLSLHGDIDNTVPFYTDMITLIGLYDIMVVEGSYSVHERAQELGMVECFKPFWGADHVPHVGNAAYLDTTTMYMSDFLLSFVCGTDIEEDCYQITEGPSSIADYSPEEISIFPNPANSIVNINFSNNHLGNTLRVFDMTGRLVHNEQINRLGQHSIDVANWKNGIYLLQLTDGQQSSTSKFVVN